MPSMKLRIYPQNIIPSWQSNFKTEFVKIKKIDPLDAQLNHFLDVIEGKSEPRVSAYDGLENLRILEAILKSTRLKKTIHV
jgi:predicted dehydrogenase